MRHFIILFFLFISTSNVFAQQEINPKKQKREEKRKKIDALMKQEEEGVIVYKKSLAIGGKLTTDGYGAFVEKGIAKSVSKALLFQIDISEKRHVKETKSFPGGFATGRPIIFGKINYLYPVKLGVQMQMLLGNRASKNGINITGNFGGGLIVGLLRPYEISMDTGSNKRANIRYESKDSLLFLDANNIIFNSQGPTFGVGWNHLKVTPGIYFKPAIRFDYGKYNEAITALEVGLLAELYAKKIPQMIYQKQRQLFLSAYVSLVFGKRK